MSSTKIAMTAYQREGTGKGTARALRRDNKIPAVIYGNNESPVTISLDENELTLEYHKGHLFTTLVDMNVDGIISDYPDRVREEMRRRGLPLPPKHPL